MCWKTIFRLRLEVTTVVYVIRNADGSVFYVGHTINIERRLAQRRGMLLGRTVTTMEGGPELEKALIQQYLPQGNKHWSVITRRRLWKKSLERRLLMVLEDLRDRWATGGGWVPMNDPDWWPRFDERPRLVDPRTRSTA